MNSIHCVLQLVAPELRSLESEAIHPCTPEPAVTGGCCERPIRFGANAAQDDVERYPGRSSRAASSVDRPGKTSNITRPPHTARSSHTAIVVRRATAAGTADAIPPFTVPVPPPTSSGADVARISRTEAAVGGGPNRAIPERLSVGPEAACAGDCS